MNRLLARLLPAALLLSLLAGCAPFDPARARRGQTADFTAELDARAEAALAAPLSLDDCVRLAMTNNYAVRLADLDRELARLGRNASFGAFLPSVAATTGYTDRDYDNLLGRTSTGGYAIGPEDESATTLSVSLPVFLPSTWFLYAAARHGYAAARTAAFYTRQSVVLQTTVDYCNVLVQQDTVAALESQLEAATQFARRVEGLAGEGFAASWEQGQAGMQVLARQTELDAARRRLVLLRARLLRTLGLPPSAPVVLSGDTGEDRLPSGSLEDLVLLALERHPALAIADRRVVMEEHAVRQAFCAFLPTLSLNATHLWGGEDLTLDAIGWSTGFRGAWSVFSGFANLSRYRAARTGRRRTELERENTFLSVIVGVIAAEADFRDASAAVALRRKAYEVFSAKADDFAARAEEGLVPLSDALDARAEMDLAQVALVRSRYQAKVAAANLELALGTTLLPEGDPAAADAPFPAEPAPGTAPNGKEAP